MDLMFQDVKSGTTGNYCSWTGSRNDCYCVTVTPPIVDSSLTCQTLDITCVSEDKVAVTLRISKTVVLIDFASGKTLKKINVNG